MMYDTMKWVSNPLDLGPINNVTQLQELGLVLPQSSPPAQPPYIMPLVWCNSHDQVLLKNPKPFAVMKLPWLQCSFRTQFLPVVTNGSLIEFCTETKSSLFVNYIENSFRTSSSSADLFFLNDIIRK